jgi:hypothetical protein
MMADSAELAKCDYLAKTYLSECNCCSHVPKLLSFVGEGSMTGRIFAFIERVLVYRVNEDVPMIIVIVKKNFEDVRDCENALCVDGGRASWSSTTLCRVVLQDGFHPFRLTHDDDDTEMSLSSLTSLANTRKRHSNLYCTDKSAKRKLLKPKSKLPRKQKPNERESQIKSRPGRNRNQRPKISKNSKKIK